MARESNAESNQAEFNAALNRLKNHDNLKEQDEIQNLIAQLEAIQKALSDHAEAERIANRIALCFDEAMIAALVADFQPEGKKSFSSAISELTSDLKNTLDDSFFLKEKIICDFALRIAIQAAPESVAKNDVKTKYQQLKNIQCFGSEQQLQSAASLLLRDRLRNEPNYNASCTAFTKKCALSPSDKAKKIGWIVGGALAIPLACVAFVALNVASFGIVGLIGLAAGVAIASAGLSFKAIVEGVELKQRAKISEIVAPTATQDKANSSTASLDDDSGPTAPATGAATYGSPTGGDQTPRNSEADFARPSAAADNPDHNIDALIKKIKNNNSLTDAEWTSFSDCIKSLSDDMTVDLKDVAFSDNCLKKLNEYGRDNLNESRLILSDSANKRLADLITESSNSFTRYD